MAGAAPERAGPQPRCIRAANPGPLTLDGTRTYLVGRARLAIIDPGPALAPHLDAIAEAADGATEATILLTHDHPDHAEGAGALAERIGARVRGAAAGTLAGGAAVDTDAGELVAHETPGHTRDHLAFHWPAAGAVFCGDLMLGGQDTALVAPPEGELAAYLASLERLRALRPRVIYPTHGPPFEDAPHAIERYVEHRMERRRQVLRALADGPLRVDGIVARVYGARLPEALRPAAAGAVLAYLRHLEAEGRVRREAETWAAAEERA